MQDSDRNTILHTLRKNNKYNSDKDTDVRARIEEYLIKDEADGGAGLKYLYPKKDVDQKRVTDYPPLIHKEIYNDFMSDYIQVTLDRFAASFDKLRMSGLSATSTKSL